MPEYRMYTVDYNCHRVDAKNIQCVDDHEAIQQALRTITSYDVEVGTDRAAAERRAQQGFAQEAVRISKKIRASLEPMLHSNAWAAISARETPVLLGIFGGSLQHSMRPPLWLAPSRYLWTRTDWPCRLGCRRL
jgi:hypothetical protein